ncbi:Amino acid permease [uncultured archaeon]|nr:Amino acid permease [uncultured archaeon]
MFSHHHWIVTSTGVRFFTELYIGESVTPFVEEKGELKRALGLFEVTLSGIGIILGAGIYALIGEAAGLAGNAVWMAFTISALVALFTGLSYAELSSMFPKAGAEYEYTTRAFGRFLAFIIGWLISFSGVIAAAAVALGFAGYLSVLSGAPRVPSALVLVALLSAVNFIGIKQSAWVAVVFTLIEALGLILAISACIVLYILVALCSVSISGWQKLSHSAAPFADIAFAALGQNASSIISVMALFAIANSALFMLLASSRVVYGMAESGSLPGKLARVHPVTRTPWVAILLSMGFCMAFVLLNDINFVANVNNFTLFITFVVVNAALIVLRYKMPDMPRPFRVPISLGRLSLLPVLGIVFNIFMLLQLSLQVLTIGLALTALGGLAAIYGERTIKHFHQT